MIISSQYLETDEGTFLPERFRGHWATGLELVVTPRDREHEDERFIAYQA